MMETSNKILLSLFASILLSITIIIFTLGSDMREAMDEGNDKETGNAEQIRNVAHFNKIEIRSKFNVHYTQDTFQRVVVKADSSLIDLAITEVNNGKLFIHSKKNLKHKQHIDVYVTTDSINEVSSEAGSVFKTLCKMKVYQFEGSGKAGATFETDGEFTDLKLAFSAGSVGNFSGKCKNLKIESNAGAVVDAGNLAASTGDISSSSGSVITISVNDELSIDASSGSIIKCHGSPQLKNLNISSGAQFIK